ncbi:GNAT family N-acetyltransferase [Celerinatantimonas sp. YJH-8]|uniref:GNAT family N-acetyltransferase n=1 Tax=Celerinatantimonas sp. YJH-8 TaxID=3228714 RepID=UPI0038CBA88E
MRHYFLTSQRLGFGIWQQEDLAIAMQLWGDFKVTRLFDNRGPLTQTQVNHRLQQEITTQQQYGYQYWPLFARTSQQLIGCAGLRPYDQQRHILEIGFHICAQYWRQGYASEAATTVIDYAFETLQVTALFAGHHPENTGSRQLLTSLGFTYTHDEFYAPTGLQHPSYLLTANSRLSSH